MAMHEPPARRPHAPAGYFWEADRLLPWSHAQQRLEEARNYWLATVRPDGHPHVTPVWGVWLDGALYVPRRRSRPGGAVRPCPARHHVVDPERLLPRRRPGRHGQG